MRIRRIKIEIEVPWEFHHLAVLAVISKALTEFTHWPHQEQILLYEESPNTQIGTAK
jgi:hypothetical protein